MTQPKSPHDARQGVGPAKLIFCVDVFGVALFLTLMVTTLLGVVARYMLLPGFEWTFELAGIAFIWIVFIGTVGAELRKENVAFEAVVQRFGPSGRRGLTVLSALVLLAVGAVMTWSAFGVIERTLHVLTPVLRLSSAIAVISVLVFAISAVLIAISRLIALALGKAPEMQS
jgi:TRAP-type C4-dicarboxylate transport system permease small subunit